MEIGVYKYKVEPRDLDLMNRPSLTAVGNYMLDAAGDDADKNGFGIKDINEENCSWVISKMALELNRYPYRHEEFTVETWVSHVERLMTTRNLVMKDLDGNVIGAAVTNWAMINLQTRRPVDLSSYTVYKNAIINNDLPIEAPRKVGNVNPTVSAPHKVVYSDIDFNGHANSMRYLMWMIDLLSNTIHSDRMFKRFDINFQHEAMLGEMLEVCLEQTDNVSIFEIRNQSGRAICKAALEWYTE